ncbi:MAG: SET domain-containing protein-lysine N-methyltransferase [Ignavibacterium sp.]|jgi:SET domain-containing protein|uniref:SET domain-containing protein n=1 Tax=Ignavibacterium album TaxID=591197 RepID=A0A7V2ZJD5_9BACT|nr:SET domain-containing protein-lysine N-methyltransferase [Ignavibacterium album]MCA2004859.1 SET domain-containing protein-lysine N-methyltransferase [Ignavibacterium sp.]MCX8106172.1 SET domain-containing protein-lysine N-methyltransferase [Ignavibacterium album]
MSLNYLYEKIIVKDSTVHGKGIFTVVPIKKGQRILIIEGEEINAAECIRRENEENNVYIFWKDDDIYIDASQTEKIKFINHSCECNCFIDEDEQGNLILTAARDISAGEELTIDYGYDEIYEECSCSSCENKLESAA